MKRHKLYDERVKKGYVQIKIAQPGVWMQKQKWVYMETHPWEDFSEFSNYIFLDGNRRNFSPENIERVTPAERLMLINMGGIKTDPAITRLNLARARLKLKNFDLGEKLGLVVFKSKSKRRAFRDDINRRAREWREQNIEHCRLLEKKWREANKEKRKKQRHAYYEKHKK